MAVRPLTGSKPGEGMAIAKLLSKIIVVDDDLTNITALKNMLRPFYEVYTALNAEKMFSLLE
ncbi:MAG: hypothetical protein FWF47_00785, partial [Clostridia bacterium]|nr:hypothetical protein [Clostridia bacterium]